MKRELIIDGGFVLALGILLAIGWISYQSLTALSEADRQENHAYMVIQELDGLRSAVTDVETGERGFIITGEEKYLEPYDDALGQVGKRLAALKKLIADDPSQHERLRDIELAVQEKLARLKLTIELRRTRGFEAAQEAVLTNKGKAQMDLIRQRIAEAQAEAQRLLQQRAGKKETESRRARRAIVVGRVISFVLLITIFLVLKKEIAQRIRAESELRVYHGRLENLVETRTGELRQEVAERRRTEALLRRANTELSRKNVEMEQFLYTVSHDLKSPVVTIQGFLGLLNDDAASGRTDHLIDHSRRIGAAAGRMSRLLNDLLQFSRVGRIPNRFTDVDLTQVAREVVAGHSRELEAARISVEIQESMPVLVADRDRMFQVLDNLVVNAIKYGSGAPEPRIEIGGHTDGDEACFFVKDNGRGIAPQFHAKVFDLFQQLGRDKEGVGLGLAIVKKIAQVHGGRVWVESAPGEGATFCLALPASQQAYAEEAAAREVTR